MTEVYAFDRGKEILPEELMLFLPPWRRERTERLKHPPARQESLAAGLLLGCVMARWGLSPWEPVATLPAGKPVFSGREDVWFSLSHSGRYALCALSTQRVGADVQLMRPVNLSMARRLHPEERDWLSRQAEEEREDAFFRLWTRKEAWVKAVSEERTLSLSETDVIHRLPGLTFRDWALPGGYRASVCAREESIPEIILLTRDDILNSSVKT